MLAEACADNGTISKDDGGFEELVGTEALFAAGWTVASTLHPFA
jgi:hypothetical protein